MKHFYLILIALMLAFGGVKAFLKLHPSAITELSKIERFGLRHHKFTDLKNELLSRPKVHKAKLMTVVKNGKKKEFDSDMKRLNIYKEFLLGQLKTNFFKDFHTRRY
jgi:hypothetical protein